MTSPAGPVPPGGQPGVSSRRGTAAHGQPCDQGGQVLRAQRRGLAAADGLSAGRAGRAKDALLWRPRSPDGRPSAVEVMAAARAMIGP
ncbi:MAG: hypothetical protein ACLQDY_25025 [Streptosporangiaceae bacterium]